MCFGSRIATSTKQMPEVLCSVYIHWSNTGAIQVYYGVLNSSSRESISAYQITVHELCKIIKCQKKNYSWYKFHTATVSTTINTTIASTTNTSKAAAAATAAASAAIVMINMVIYRTKFSQVTWKWYWNIITKKLIN